MGVALLLPAQTALKLCVSALEKYPDSALLKALKSVALMRTGRQAEAHKVGVEVVGLSCRCCGSAKHLHCNHFSSAVPRTENDALTKCAFSC